jgi:hypothetical protein
MQDGDDAVGFYAKYVLPRIIDLAMRNEETARLRAGWIPQARGEVLEVGIGSGLNLPFYSSDVQRVHGVDPSLELQRIARKRAMAGLIEVDFLSQSAEEQLPRIIKGRPFWSRFGVLGSTFPERNPLYDDY